jgi:hypothetical protein
MSSSEAASDLGMMDVGLLNLISGTVLTTSLAVTCRIMLPQQYSNPTTSKVDRLITRMLTGRIRPKSSHINNSHNNLSNRNIIYNMLSVYPSPLLSCINNHNNRRLSILHPSLDLLNPSTGTEMEMEMETLIKRLPRRVLAARYLLHLPCSMAGVVVMKDRDRRLNPKVNNNHNPKSRHYHKLHHRDQPLSGTIYGGTTGGSSLLVLPHPA